MAPGPIPGLVDTDLLLHGCVVGDGPEGEHKVRGPIGGGLALAYEAVGPVGAGLGDEEEEVKE